MNQEVSIIDLPDVVEKRLRESDEKKADQQRSALRKMLPTGLAWDKGGRELATEAVLSHGRSAAEHLWEMGRWIAYAKTQLDHGEYGKWLAQIGVDRHFAARCVAVAARLPERFNVVGQTKAIALLGLSDEQITELDELGIVGAITSDEIERMSVAELRERVRDLKGRVDKGREQLNKMRQRHDEVEAENEKLRDSNASLKRKLKKHEAFLEQVAITQAQITDLSNVIEKMEVTSDVAPIIRDQVAGLLRSIDRVIQKRPDLFAPEAAVESEQDKEGDDQ